jgi:myo-inositol-1(or 4)-monophosphatase
MADVEFAFVYDFGPAEEWWARRGQGAWLNERQLDPTLAERRARDGRLEVLGIESADPRWVAASIDALVGCAYRLRALGTIASSLCQVAAARFDGMVSLRRSRGVDDAAGQLIVREAGGLVSFPGCDQPLGAPLTAEPSSPVIAARSTETLSLLERIPA